MPEIAVLEESVRRLREQLLSTRRLTAGDTHRHIDT